MPHPPAQGSLESDGACRGDTHGYALSGRLDTVHRGGALVSDYGFDDNGNRTTHRIGPASPLRGQSWPCLGALPAGGDVTVSGSYDAQDRMSAYGSCSYEYTRNGELTRRVDSATNSTTEYDYDEFGNLRRVVLPDTRVITYHIDGLNRRVGKSINGARQWGLLYANQLEPVAELDADGNVVASFIYADRPHVPSLMLKGGQTYRILADHLGSVRLVVNIATGAIAQRMAYDEYGNVVEDTNPGFQPFGYAGGIYDRDTGLVRFGARDYDAVAGRWTAKDPIGFGGGLLSLYSYVGSSPLDYIDRTGRVREKIDGNTITVHNNDPDNWPSNPHGHIYDKNLVVDTDGNIYNKTTKQQVDQLSKKGKVKWGSFLRRAGFLGACLSVADLMTGEVEADEMFADFLMIGSAGPEGTYWPEEVFGSGISPLDCGAHCPY